MGTLWSPPSDHTPLRTSFAFAFVSRSNLARKMYFSGRRNHAARNICFHVSDFLKIGNREIGTDTVHFFLKIPCTEFDAEAVRINQIAAGEMLQADLHHNPELLKLARKAEATREPVFRRRTDASSKRKGDRSGRGKIGVRLRARYTF